MQQQLLSFVGAELGATLVLACIFIAEKKKNVWVYAMFAGVIGMAVSGFGYIMPEIPNPDLIYIYSVLCMMFGVMISYFQNPSPPDSTQAQLLAEAERRLNGLRIMVVGASITVIVATVSYFFVSRMPANASGIMSILFRVEKGMTGISKGQDSILHRLDELERDQKKRAKQYTIDSLANVKREEVARKLIKYQDKVLDNQRLGLKQQSIIIKNGNRVPAGMPVYPKLQPKVSNDNLPTSKVKPVFSRPLPGRKTSYTKKDSAASDSLDGAYDFKHLYGYRRRLKP